MALWSRCSFLRCMLSSQFSSFRQCLVMGACGFTFHISVYTRCVANIRLHSRHYGWDRGLFSQENHKVLKEKKYVIYYMKFMNKFSSKDIVNPESKQPCSYYPLTKRENNVPGIFFFTTLYCKTISQCGGQRMKRRIRGWFYSWGIAWDLPIAAIDRSPLGSQSVPMSFCSVASNWTIHSGSLFTWTSKILWFLCCWAWIYIA